MREYNPPKSAIDKQAKSTIEWNRQIAAYGQHPHTMQNQNIDP